MSLVVCLHLYQLNFVISIFERDEMVVGWGVQDGFKSGCDVRSVEGDFKLQPMTESQLKFTFCLWQVMKEEGGWWWTWKEGFYSVRRQCADDGGGKRWGSWQYEAEAPAFLPLFLPFDYFHLNHLLTVFLWYSRDAPISPSLPDIFSKGGKSLVHLPP